MLVLGSTVLSHNFQIIVPLPKNVVLETVAFLSGIVEGRFFGLVIEVSEQSVEIFIDLLLLILYLLVLGLALPTTELCPLLVFQDVDQLPPALEVDLVLVVAHSSKTLLRVVHLQLSEVL